jgi:hypothetical protein
LASGSPEAASTRDAVAEMDVDNFDVLLERSPGQPLVMGIVLHAYIVQPYPL